MHSLRLVAAAAILLASQAHAVTTIAPNALTATPSGQANGREMLFKLPLLGNTQNCVITISYGEAPGVGMNNDGDTNLNGQSSLDRRRTYSADGTYTFKAKAKSGCTGEAQVTFTIGNGARTHGGISPAVLVGSKPAQATADSTAPGLTVTPTKITGIVVSSKKVTVGEEFSVKQTGVGDAKNPSCGSRVSLKRLTGSAMSGVGYSQTSSDTLLWQWPKTQTFVANTPGTYEVQLGVYQGGAAACGYTGAGSIPGDLTKIEVTDGIAK